MGPFAPEDLAPEERHVHRLLAAVPPRALPVGFRDDVMRRLTERSGVAWEWIAAGALALPSLAFLVYQLIDRGDELGAAVNNVIAAASSDAADAFFFVDGTTVLALAILGVASLIAAHASIIAPQRRTAAR
ncbi:MAG: hypothetical protein E6I51_00210 [Chloroflexi bacterium]|nr:MAG: hypothetical protein E6I51_00210 [Chloroflexota bacterium]TMF25068.1 MAG: hypothetical protein E6I28_09995 [Chloroflexota bacterium]